MKFKGPFFFSMIAVAFLIGAAYYPSPNSAEKEVVLMQTILSGLNQLHYRPQAIDDEFSSKLYDLFVERLDGGKRWFTAEDLDQLKKYRLQLDDEANTGSFDFFDASTSLLSKRIDQTKDYYAEFLAKPFDFSKEETIELDGEKKEFAKNNKELKEYWRKSMKYETLVRLNNKLKEQEELEEGEEAKSFEELEKEAREAVLETYDDWYQRMQKRRRSDYMSDYLNTITNIFDPHTGYYEPKDKENFDIGMSGTLEGIGARLQTDGDYTKVVSIVPGGPAWKQKSLEENDLIMKVTQGDESNIDAVDVTGFRIDDVVKLIRGKKGTTVTLTVKKVNGTIDDITITRDVVQLDESYARSVILDMPGRADKIGYIKLPRFYADFNRRGGRSCSKDIAAELEKLQAVGVNGVILDLRNNGGGSLRDVVTMSGLFIEEGPIVQVKSRSRRPEVLADEDPQVQYGGPLIVMVNSFSASASEILAAALQDYERAVVVGSNSTFGKGTVQRFFDLDRAVRGKSDIKPLGEVKLTIQKFYRVDGGSTQLKGVVPDIILPDRYHYFDMGEKENEYAMEWTQIPSVRYAQNVTRLSKLEEIKAKSATRVAENATFAKVLDNAKRLKDQSELSAYSLNMDAFKADEQAREEAANKFKDMFKPIDGLAVTNLEVDMTDIESDESKKARNDEWIKGIKKDIYIEETLAIMGDLMNE
ncbi:MAG: carboxy terminal-processing peptidase [Bacteroidota bacterium]